jgi:hypothetical protein
MVSKAMVLPMLENELVSFKLSVFRYKDLCYLLKALHSLLHQAVKSWVCTGMPISLSDFVDR